MTGCIQTAKINAVSVFFFHQSNIRIVEFVRVHMGDGYGRAVGFAHKGQNNTLALSHLPPHGGIHKDHIALGVAGIDHHNGKFFTIVAFGNIHQIFTGVIFAVAVVVTESKHTHIHGAMAGDHGAAGAPDLCAVGQAFFNGAVLGLILCCHFGCGVV